MGFERLERPFKIFVGAGKRSNFQSNLQELQSGSKGSRIPIPFHVGLYGICSYPAIHTHKHGLIKVFPPPHLTDQS